MRSLRTFFLSAIAGLAGLAAVNLTAQWTGLALGWSGLSAGTALLLGLPGTVLLAVLRLF